MPQWHIPNQDENDVRRLAQLVAIKLQPGDVLRLSGDLGAGKTTFARALIRAVAGDTNLEVPSPTFSLLQTYALARLHLAHLDLYRLQDTEELHELGLDELLETYALLVEWPSKLPPSITSDTLTLTFEDSTDATRRSLTLDGQGRWSAHLERLKNIATFLQRDTALKIDHVRFMQGDASTRSYARLTGPEHNEILMDAPRQPDGPKVRNGKSYSQLAHLAEDVRAFVAVDIALRETGVAAPEIYDVDLERGLVRLQDFGTETFAKALRNGTPQAELWQAATDVLLRLKEHAPPQTIRLPDGSTHDLPVFTADVMAIEAELLPQWYWPLVHGGESPAPLKRTYEELWRPHFDCVSANPKSWLLRDYHSPNLIWLDKQSGDQNVGVIDFQDALRGPGEYDLVSLLQDARLDVPEALETNLLAHYRNQMANREPDFSTDDFAYRYAVMGAQRAAKILGIFARLSKRDGKHTYLAHMPRIWGYLERNLRHPKLTDLKDWFDGHFSSTMRHRTEFNE